MMIPNITREMIQAGKVWFISDMHFGHNNIVKFSARDGFDSGPHENHDYELHNQIMVDRWNERVAPDDIVICLGDVAMNGRAAEQWVDQLNGTIYWIRGNHDKKGVPDAVTNAGWILIEEFTITWRAEATEREPETPPVEMHITHYPLKGAKLVRGHANIHGHVHNNPYEATSGHLNLSAEVTGLAPINAKPVLNKMAFHARRRLQENVKGDSHPNEKTVLHRLAVNKLDLTGI